MGRFRWQVCLALLLICPRSQARERELLVAAYQGPCSEGQFEQNLAVARQVTQDAQRLGCHFVLFPECFLSGSGDPAAVRRGARAIDAPALQQFIADTADQPLVVLIGMARRQGERLFNSQLVIHQGHLLGWHDKIRLTDGDQHTLGFTAGQAVPVFTAHGSCFAINIGQDASVPQAAMLARQQGAQLLFVPHTSQRTEEAADRHDRWLRQVHDGLATHLQLAIVRSSAVQQERSGPDEPAASYLIGPQGQSLAEAAAGSTALIAATVSPEMYCAANAWSGDQDTPGWLRDQLSAVLGDFRPPLNDQQLQEWLENMLVHHRFELNEISAATGLTLGEVRQAIQRLDVQSQSPPPRSPTAALTVLPYPGGRHPRIGFREGAVAPQRDTKFSVFTPWEDGGYVVADVPEAIFSNLGLTYLAHTHIPTMWDRQGIRLPRQEWQRGPGGDLYSHRQLPNGIAFGAHVIPASSEVQMSLWLTNGTADTLSGLRVQNCIMLAGANGFQLQSNSNKHFRPPYAAASNLQGNRWIITAWKPVQNCWGNQRCPCLHSDPQFPDCPPQQTVTLSGWLSFFEGTTIDDELARIEALNWWDRPVSIPASPR